jgi:hypothetical protein
MSELFFIVGVLLFLVMRRERCEVGERRSR